jgi:hypothetical protein
MILEQRPDKTKIVYPYIVNNDSYLKEFTDTSIKLKEIGVRYIALIEFPLSEESKDVLHSDMAKF